MDKGSVVTIETDLAFERAAQPSPLARMLMLLPGAWAAG
jgi:hypothetical protein